MAIYMKDLYLPKVEVEGIEQQEIAAGENNETGMAVTTDEKFEETEGVSEESVSEVSIEEESVDEESANETNRENTAGVEVAISKAENLVNEALKAACEKAFEEGRIAGLQEAILARMERNGYVTEQMRNDVRNQTHIQSLINWVKSF